MNETFYGGFYGFEAAPFHITPDPTLLFPTETHRAALGAIEYGIAAGKGFIVVTGEVGVGKTTVLRVCLDGLDPRKIKIIYLFNPALTTAELYATVLEEFDVTLPPTLNMADMLRMLQRTLLATHEAGMQVVLAVDEAQLMPESTLESLRVLSNLETHKSKLLQIILVGQPELEAVLAKHSMRQLAQRISVRARVSSLTFRQSCRYIVHRTRLAGRVSARPLFTTPALLYLAFIAGGIPRTINVCCDNALINGYGHAAERITFGIVREATRSMKFRPLRRATAIAVGLIAVIGLVVVGNALLRHSDVDDEAPVATQEQPHASGPSDTASSPGAAAKLASSKPTEEASPASPADQASAEPGSHDTAAASADTAAADSTAATPPPSAPSDTPNGAQQPQGAQGKPAMSAESGGAPAAVPAEAPASLRPGSWAPGNAAPIPWIASSGEAASSETRPASKPAGPSHATTKWIVREGDTVYKACRATYGSCDARTLRAVIADNPNLGRDATIYRGDVLVMPKHPPGAN
jgi:general secretion pathway protein A